MCQTNPTKLDVPTSDMQLEGYKSANDGSRSSDIDDSESKYRSRKPKWWAQLARRRGTRAQRQAMQRMTDKGCCMPKEILSDFSRLNNRSKMTELVDTAIEIDAWNRGWWNRALSIADTNHSQIEAKCAHDTTFISDEQNMKYAHKFNEMIAYKNPLPPREYKQKWLEIGFGNGDNLFCNACNNEDTLYMGSEIHQPGIGALAQKIEEASRSNKSVENIRVLPGDGIKLLSHLPNNFLDAILITFPDPWPKEFHARWRVIQTETIREMKRVLDNDGCVFVATDAKCFDSWAREIFTKGCAEGIADNEVKPEEEQRAWKEVTPCPSRESWLPNISYYEQKGINEGRHTMLQCWKISKAKHYLS
jgi:tRNA (guanine-N(7)-)-methyltransferase